MASDPANVEARRRNAIWEALLAKANPQSVKPAVLGDVGVRPPQTGQGVFRDSVHTAQVAPPHGVTLTLLDTGTRYDDAFDDDGGVYHYPSTKRAGRDVAEIKATKSACTLGLPVFVVLRGPTSTTRCVKRAWVTDWDDDSRSFLVTFGERSSPSFVADQPFELCRPRRSEEVTTVALRRGQAAFKFQVVKRYGAACALCGMAVRELLEAAHICPVADRGSDDPRNGLVLCSNHHRAFDAHLLGFDPATTAVRFRDSASAADLGVTVTDLSHLRQLPELEALEWRWQRYPLESPR